MPKLSVDQLTAEVGKRVRLNKNGWGLCPFHREDKPSFHVFQDKHSGGRFHCFGCGADGDSGDWFKRLGTEVSHEPYRTALPEVARQREQAREKAWNEMRDYDQDLPEVARDFIRPATADERLQNLQWQLQRRLRM